MDINNLIEKSYSLKEKKGNEKITTLFFEIGKKDINPGNFFMLSYNGAQKPFSVSHYDGKTIGFTIENRGESSSKMIKSKSGEYFGLTGPLGSSFKIDNIKKPLLIAGGIGAAPIFFLATKLAKIIDKVDFLVGARNKVYLEYCLELKKNHNINLTLYTDDGSIGEKGFVTKDLNDFLKNNYDSLFICGPEIMMKYVLDNVNSKIENIQISMERYMKCGIGLCGSCALDGIGLRVCTEGPVFDANTIKKSIEFGIYHRDKNGIKQKI